MLAYQPQGMYLTHYGRVGHSYADVEKLAHDLYEQIDAMKFLAQEANGKPNRHTHMYKALSDFYLQRACSAEIPLATHQVEKALAIDIELNAQGLACWLDRDRRKT